MIRKHACGTVVGIERSKVQCNSRGGARDVGNMVGKRGV